ncbi:MAG TPA: hypothetical protein VGK19_15865 [Capsulimonadaceae bacterium]|jgi:hypothetical protein
MANQPTKQNGSFLGKGELKFNQAGDNAPMPGETVAETPPQPWMGGPKVWIGVVVIIVAMSILFVIYSQHYGVSTNGGQRPGVSIEGPHDSPDSIK